MLNTLVDIIMERSPAARRRLIRFWYQMLSRLDTDAVMPFMNYGYVDLDPDAPELPLGEHDATHRYCVQLYHHVAGAIDLAGKAVLEVGCGRGGGASYVARELRPRSMTGVDFSDRAIRFCAGYHRASGARFLPADAEALPFAAEVFDAVVNVESSHCYTSMERFASEVYRVLRPGGCLLYTDFREREQIGALRDTLTGAGFAIVAERAITPNIVRALDLDNDRKQALIRRYAPRILSTRFAQFAAIRGTSVYEGFRTGRLDYRSFVLQKPSAASYHTKFG
jgi:ubiquinone/menaquinone biosynthesis C-methylase UbiE